MAFDLDDEELKKTREELYHLKPTGGKKGILPKKGETPKATVEMGTVYDINKQLVTKYEKEITMTDFSEKIDTFLNYILEKKNTYYMLLCNEEKDYTPFHLIDKDKYSSQENAFRSLRECIFNRGSLYGFDITEDNGAIEIWILKDNGLHCYYFFAADDAVIEC